MLDVQPLGVGDEVVGEDPAAAVLSAEIGRKKIVDGPAVVVRRAVHMPAVDTARREAAEGQVVTITARISPVDNAP